MRRAPQPPPFLMSSQAPSPFPPNGPLVDLSSTYGPVLIAMLFSAGYVKGRHPFWLPYIILWWTSMSRLLGITICQVWNYHNNFPRDKPVLKIVVSWWPIICRGRVVFTSCSGFLCTVGFLSWLPSREIMYRLLDLWKPYAWPLVFMGYTII